ncbi:MAG: hypothetical protein U1E17_08365 [Geminicoccaceae bacterium]
MTLGHRDLAIPLGVVVAAVLAYEQPLHGLVAKLGWTDVFAALWPCSRAGSSRGRSCPTARSIPGVRSTPMSSGSW